MQSLRRSRGEAGDFSQIAIADVVGEKAQGVPGVLERGCIRIGPGKPAIVRIVLFVNANPAVAIMPDDEDFVTAFRLFIAALVTGPVQFPPSAAEGQMRSRQRLG